MFNTKDNHVVVMEQGCDEHEQPGGELASLGGILPGINPMIPDRSWLGLTKILQLLGARTTLVR